MKRQEKYPDTNTFHYHNANPKNRITGDCVMRAIATATGIPYNDVVRGLAEITIKTGYCGLDNKGMDAYLKSIGWVKHSQPRKFDNTKYTGEEFCEELNLGARKGLGAIIANIGGHHTVAITKVNGRYKVCDIWNSTNGCVGNYWVKA